MATQDRPIGKAKKDPSAVRTFRVDWSAAFPTETISSQLWKLPAGITKDAEAMTSKVHSITLSGGTSGERYLVTSQITTSAGEIDERSIEIQVIER